MTARKRRIVATAVIATSVLAACSKAPVPTPPSPPEPGTTANPIEPNPAVPNPSEPSPPSPPTSAETESNPPGDIPDNQAYVPFSPPGAGFSVKIPEGWASSTKDATATFTDKLNQVQVSSVKVATAPTVDSVTATDMPALTGQVPKFAMGQVTAVNRKAGPGVLVTYQGDSAPDPVTGKVYRDAFERYILFHNGTRVDLTLSGPTNADNVDPWRTVTDSLVWQ